MSDADPVTRREVDQLTNRIESIDNHGTRNSSLIELATRQNTEAIKAVKDEITQRFAAHDTQHRLDRDERIRSRRWRIGAATAGIGAMAALVAALFTIAAQLAHIGG